MVSLENALAFTNTDWVRRVLCCGGDVLLGECVCLVRVQVEGCVLWCVVVVLLPKICSAYFVLMFCVGPSNSVKNTTYANVRITKNIS